jgi:hypothetical protein
VNHQDFEYGIMRVTMGVSIEHGAPHGSNVKRKISVMLLLLTITTRTIIQRYRVGRGRQKRQKEKEA